MPYEIRIVFQTIEAYQSAVDRLYAVFGVALPAPEPSANGGPEEAADVTSKVVELSEDDLSAEPPSPPGRAYTFVVEDRTG